MDFGLIIAGALIVFGLYQIFWNRAIFFGGLMGSLGLMLFLNNFFDGVWSFFVPLILIFLGLEIILSKTSFKRTKTYKMKENISPDDVVEGTAFFSGVNRTVTSKNFSGGSLSAVLGGIELDLTQSQLAKGGAVLHISCLLGGVEIKVPPTMIVKNELNVILGGGDVKGYADSTATETLVIQGSCTLGGAEIKYI